jgi:predicted signal transduction protein with EAL and GGDEF domain
VIKPIELNGQECRVTASIGISVFPTTRLDESSLMMHADIAMYHAKEEGKNNSSSTTVGSKRCRLERLTLETGCAARSSATSSLHYQAKLDLANNAIAGVEALLRWNMPSSVPCPRPSSFRWPRRRA